VQSLEKIGKELGITRERVRQLEQDGLARLAVQLDDLANAA
jgi:DNA-directed RNA polymerase sigma subunit (sigma70/sigma32)